MKYIIFKIIALLLIVNFTNNCLAQNQKIEKIYGGSNNDLNYGLVATKDGGLAICGTTSSSGAGGTDAFIIKTNGLGQTIWSKTYGRSKNDAAWKIANTRDSGFIIAGTTQNTLNNNLDASVFKIDKLGNVVWNISYSSDSVEEFYNIYESKFGSFYLTGTIKTDTNNYNVFVVKIRNNGTIKWNKHFGEKGIEEGYALAEENNGNFCIVGMLEDKNITAGGKAGTPTDKDLFLLRLDSNGNKKWMRQIGTTESEQAWDMIYFKGKYWITGWQNNATNGDDILLISVDTSGAVSNSYLYQEATNERAFGIEINPDETISLIGYIDKISPNTRDIIMLNVDLTGKIITSKTYGTSTGTDGHWPSSIKKISDGSFVILSSSNSFRTGKGQDVYLIKTDNKFNANCNYSSNNLNFAIPIFENNIFGNDYFGGAVSYPSLSVSNSNFLDSTICCKLKAEVSAPIIKYCKGQAVTLGKPTIKGLIYKWTQISGGTFTSSEANPSLQLNGDAKFKLVVSSTDNQCAPDSAYVDVFIRSELQNKNFINDTFFCKNSNVRLKGPDIAIAYLWAGRTINESTQNVKISNADTIILTIRDTNTCTYSDTFKVKINPLPEFRLGNDTTICENSKITLKGPSKMTNYFWNNGQGANQTFVVSEERKHFLVVTDSFGCKFGDTMILYNNPVSYFSLGKDSAICPNDSLIIYGPTFLRNYIWNGIPSLSAIKTVYSSGTYVLQASNSLGCATTDTIVIKPKNAPFLELGPNSGICIGGTKVIRAPKGGKYLWSDGSSYDSLIASVEGKYYLRYQGPNKCYNSDTILLSSLPKPIVNLGKDTTICIGDSITLDAGMFNTYAWSNGKTTRTIKVKSQATYEVTVSDANGCKNVDDILIKTKDCLRGIKYAIIKNVKLYPNPNTGNFELSFFNTSEQAIINIYTTNGTLIYQNTISQKGQIQHKIELDNQYKGLLFIQINNNEGQFNSKLIVK